MSKRVPGPRCAWSLASAIHRRTNPEMCRETVLAIPAHQMDIVRKLVVQLNIKLGTRRGFDDRRIEIDCSSCRSDPVGKGNAFLAFSRFQTGLIMDWGITSVLPVVGSTGKGCRSP